MLDQATLEAGGNLAIEHRPLAALLPYACNALATIRLGPPRGGGPKLGRDRIGNRCCPSLTTAANSGWGSRGHAEPE